MNDDVPPEPVNAETAVVARPAATEPARLVIKTVLERLNLAVSGSALKPAVRFMGRTLTWREVEAKVRERTSVLRRLGVGPGVRLGLLLPNGPAHLYYVYAAYSVGATVVPLDPDLPADALRDVLKRTGVRIIVSCDSAEVLGRLQPLVQQGAIDRVVVVSWASMLPMGAAVLLRLTGPPRFTRAQTTLAPALVAERDLLTDGNIEAVAAGGQMPRLAEPEDDAIAAPVGRSSVPPAVMTHAGLATNLDQLLEALRALRMGAETLLAAVPLSHPLSLIATLHVATACAAELVIPENLTPEGLARVFKSGARPTVLVTTPTALDGFLATSEHTAAALASLRFILIVGGGAHQRLHAAVAAFTSAPLIQSYGIDAAAAFAAVTRVGDPAVPLGGHCLSGTRVVVCDLADRTRQVPQGERGEICVTGPQIALRTGLEAGGLLRTGDLGLIDADGRIVLVDRIEDLIVAAGYMIYPGRIEDALLEHPDIEAAAVIGIGDGRRGNAPKAFVIARRGAAITERDLRLHLASRVSKIEMPADIDFCKVLPRTPFGGVCKHTLRQQEAGRRG